LQVGFVSHQHANSGAKGLRHGEQVGRTRIAMHPERIELPFAQSAAYAVIERGECPGSFGFSKLRQNLVLKPAQKITSHCTVRPKLFSAWACSEKSLPKITSKSRSGSCAIRYSSSAQF